MSNDLEAFLKKAAQRRAERQRPSIEIVQQTPAAPPPTVQPEVIDAMVISDDAASGGIQYAGEEPRFGLSDRPLAVEVGLADEKMEAHLHEHFDHQLGNLEYEEAATTRKKPTFASQLVALLKDPHSIRQAIVLNEIFRRPDSRWS